MTRRYHLPSVVTGGEELPAAQRQRLAAAVLEAVARAVRTAAPADGAVVPTAERQPAREAFARQRVAADGGAYAVPSYNGRGRPVGVPLRQGHRGAPARGTSSRVASFPFRVVVHERMNSDQLLREFVSQYRRTVGADETARVLGEENWRWTSTHPPQVTAADVTRGYTMVHVFDSDVPVADAGQRAANERAVAQLDAGQRDALNAEVDRRFSTATGRVGRLGTSAEDRQLAAYRLAVRDELLAQRREIDELPQRIRDFLFAAGATRELRPADYAMVLLIARRIALLSDAELAGYRAKVNAQTTDWSEFGESVDRYLAEVTRFEEAGDAVERARTALFGMERLYALYKEWRDSRGMSRAVPAADESGVRDRTRAQLQQEEDRIDAEFRAALAANNIASPAAFEALIADFLAAFERKTVLIGLDLLARYDHLLYAEEQRFQAPGAADRLVASLAGTSARALYAEADDRAAGARMIMRDPDLHRYLPGEYAMKVRLEAEAVQARSAADRLVNAAAASPLVSENGFDRAALASAASAADVLRVVQDYVAEHREGIVTTRSRLGEDRAFVYDLPPLLQASMEQQDIRSGTVYNQIVKDKIRSLRVRKIVTAIMLAVVTIAISVATAGTGTVAVLGAATVFGLGAWQAIEAYQEYSRGHAAHLAGLLDEDPWFGWVVVAAVGAGIDLAGVAAAIQPAESALRTFKATNDVARLAADLRAARISERLAASIVNEARATAGLTAALEDLGAITGRLNMFVGGLDAIGPLARAAYFAARRGAASLDRFVAQLKAARLIAEGELSAAQMVRLRAVFRQASTASRRLRTLGRELGLSEEQVAAVAEWWGANPTRTLAEVEEQMRALAAGADRLSRSVQAGWLPFRFEATPAAWRALDNMPAGYAVYLVRDAGGRVIYVGVTGKKGWTRWLGHLREKGGEWLGQASRFEFTAVGLDTERLALALEDSLMRQYRTEFNHQWTYVDRFGQLPEPGEAPGTNVQFFLDLIHE